MIANAFLEAPTPKFQLTLGGVAREAGESFLAGHTDTCTERTPVTKEEERVDVGRSAPQTPCAKVQRQDISVSG